MPKCQAGVVTNLASQANTVVKDWIPTTTVLLENLYLPLIPTFEIAPCLAVAIRERANRGCVLIMRLVTDHVTSKLDLCSLDHTLVTYMYIV